MLARKQEKARKEKEKERENRRRRATARAVIHRWSRLVYMCRQQANAPPGANRPKTRVGVVCRGVIGMLWNIMFFVLSMMILHAFYICCEHLHFARCVSLQNRELKEIVFGFVVGHSEACLMLRRMSLRTSEHIQNTIIAACSSIFFRNVVRKK
jgi:hypothetical protein